MGKWKCLAVNGSESKSLNSTTAKFLLMPTWDKCITLLMDFVKNNSLVVLVN